MSNLQKDESKSAKDKNELKNKIQSNSEDFGYSLLLTIILFMPFIVVKYGQRYYVDGKVVVLYAAGAILFVLLMLSSKVRVVNETKVALVFLATIAIATMFSNFSSTALKGSIERREGAIMFFVYIILFIAASSFFTINRRNVMMILSAGSIMSVYTILQMYHIDPIQMILYKSIVTPNTSIGTIGNSNFVSSYLCMFLIIAVALYIYKNKLIYLGFSAILYLGFLAARTRGGWLSFGIVCFVGLLFIVRNKEKLIRAGIIIVTFCILTFFLNAITNNQIFDRAKFSNILVKTDQKSETNSNQDNSETQETNNKENSQSQSVQDDSNVDSAQTSESNNSENGESNIQLQGSVSSRTNILKVTFKAFLQKPFLGEGPDTLGLRLKRDFKKEYNEHIKKYNESIDKAHNEYLEYATSDGILTLISYLVLVVMILYKLFGKRNDENSIILFLGILIYLVQAFFNISVIMVAPLFWILLGCSVKYIYDNKTV